MFLQGMLCDEACVRGYALITNERATQEDQITPYFYVFIDSVRADNGGASVR